MARIAKLRARDLAREDRDIYVEVVEAMPPADVMIAPYDWYFWESDEQGMPVGAWRVWLIMAGRGFGKTRTGAEWVRALAESCPDLRIALVGASIAEVRAVMVEGESGLLAICPPWHKPHWEPSLGRLTWPNGTQAFVYSGSHPDALRGSQHHYAWCDEIAKWAKPDETWNQLQLGLRLGKTPQTVVTTTPRTVPVMKRLLSLAGHAVTRGATFDNPHLPPAYVEAMIADFGRTRLGRQELEGELIETPEGALWSRMLIEARRVPWPPSLRRVVVGVDPPAGTISGNGGDACGIIAVGVGEDGRAYVLEDASIAAKTPETWANAVRDCCARVGADRVVAEANNGGQMVQSVLRAAQSGMPVKLVHASRGKVARAEPVMALYENGRAFHAGVFPELEDEMCGLVVGGGYQGPGRSPDRADALVWAMTELMLGAERAEPRVRVL